MKIDRVQEVVPSRRAEAARAVIRSGKSIPGDVSVASSVVLKEKDPQVSPAGPDPSPAYFPSRPAPFQIEAADYPYSYPTRQDENDFVSWVNTVNRIEGRYLPKGLYIDTFA